MRRLRSPVRAFFPTLLIWFPLRTRTSRSFNPLKVPGVSSMVCESWLKSSFRTNSLGTCTKYYLTLRTNGQRNKRTSEQANKRTSEQANKQTNKTLTSVNVLSGSIWEMRFSPRSRWVKAGSLRRISCTHNTLFVMRNTDVGVESLSMNYSNHDNYHRGHNHICDLSARCLTHKLSKHTLVPFSILQKSTSKQN